MKAGVPMGMPPAVVPSVLSATPFAAACVVASERRAGSVLVMMRKVFSMFWLTPMASPAGLTCSFITLKAASAPPGLATYRSSWIEGTVQPSSAAAALALASALLYATLKMVEPSESPAMTPRFAPLILCTTTPRWPR